METETIDLTNFTKAHLLIVWPNKAWTVFDIPPSWFSLMEIQPVFCIEQV